MTRGVKRALSPVADAFMAHLGDLEMPKDEGDKMIRWHIDGDALAVLNQVYSLEPFPNTALRKQLALKLGAHPRQARWTLAAPVPNPERP